MGVQLLVCTRDSPSYSRKFSLRMRAGDTVQFKYEIDADTWYGYLPGVGEGSFDAKLVRPKVREEWTLEDVAEYVVKPATKRSETAGMTFVDTLRTAQRGRPYKGLYVSAPNSTTPFRSLVQTLAAYIDRCASEEDRFVWLELFCTSPHAHLTAPSQGKLLDQMASRFSERIMFFAAPWSVQRSANGVMGRGVVMEKVEARGQSWKLCLTKDALESIAAVMAQIAFIKRMVQMHQEIFGANHAAFGLFTGSVGQGGKKAKGKAGLEWNKPQAMWEKKMKIPDGPVQVLSPFVDGSSKAKKGKLKEADSEGVFLGQQSFSMHDGLGLGVGFESLIHDQELTEMLPEHERPGPAQESFVRAIMSRNESF